MRKWHSRLAPGRGPALLSRLRRQGRRLVPRWPGWRFVSWGAASAGAALIAGLGILELRTSGLQARFFSGIAEQVQFHVETGPSDRIRFPEGGPYDRRLGYTEFPRIRETLENRGFSVTRQARVSERFESLLDRGLFPIYRPKTRAGLEIVDHQGETFFEVTHPRWGYDEFDEIPEALWRALLFIEDRGALDFRHPRRNPAVDWARFGRSAFELGLRTVGSDRNVPGASTLATQMEKFRHSPGGITETPRDKALQMVSASLRAYMDGEETGAARRWVVLDYLNSVPLAGAPGQGEVNGIGEGLRVWYGADLERVNALLREVPLPPRPAPPAPREADLPIRFASHQEDGDGDRISVAAKAVDEHGRPTSEAGTAFRKVLSLLLAQRRPTYYLATPEGRGRLGELTDAHLRLLEREGVIGPELAARALETDPRLQWSPGAPTARGFVEQKAANSVRTTVLSLTGTPSLYELDRYDLRVESTFHRELQDHVTEYLASLQDPDAVRQQGLMDYRLLDRGDPSKVVYSVTLIERTDEGNVVRVQADNHDAPFDMNASVRLELGSTAKLRTLVSYLQVIEKVHGELAGLPSDSIRASMPPERDRLGRWVAHRLLERPETTRREILEAAMERRYSANPQERFATGGGIQTFSNFDTTFDHQRVTVREGLQESVNLVFIRMMRDLVDHYVHSGDGPGARVLAAPDAPEREEYLARFAELEGTQFLDRFYRQYREDRDPDAILSGLTEGRRLTPTRAGWAFRTVRPDADTEELREFLRRHAGHRDVSRERAAALHRQTNPEGHTLSDLGYLSSVHPLELWLAGYLLEHPEASRSDVMKASTDVRQEVYGWLFRTRRRHAQDQRIRTILEMEAFEEIHREWAELGYPFRGLVPSLGTAIGSSGDRPSSLGDLLGILLNDGVRYPTYRVSELHFAADTPFETVFRRDPPEGERVLSAELAGVVREALAGVVEGGTGRRVAGHFRDAEGQVVPVGGKTGTGDNRYRVFGPRGELLESRAVNRTSTFVFFLGNRYYGVISAYVPGEDSDDFAFTSALPAQILQNLAPVLSKKLLH